jgi:hypothetical protein
MTKDKDELLPGTAAKANSEGSTPIAKYGIVDVSRWRRLHREGVTLRVLLDGVDVTLRCAEADDGQGRAELICRDPHRHSWLVADGPAHLGGCGNLHRLFVTGDVVMEPMPLQAQSGEQPEAVQPSDNKEQGSK